MPSQASISRQILTIVAVNTASALVYPLMVWSVSDSTNAASLLHDFWVSLLYTQVIGTPLLLLFPSVWRKTRRYQPFWEWIALTVFFLSVAAAGCLLAESIELAAGRFAAIKFWPRFWAVLKACMVFTVVFGIMRKVYMSLRAQLEETTLQLRDKELQHAQTMKLATEARLAALESQIQPHFLFNALNSITSLIPVDPQRAERLMARMAALLRFSLDAHSGGLVSLSKETKLVTDYLEIEQARLGERLNYDIQIPAEFMDTPVPPFSIQTLVENSIKHAIAPLRAGGQVRVAVAKDNGMVTIRVTDTGPGFRLDDIPQGHGLSNLQGRLLHIFGERAKLTVSNHNGTTTTQVTIPRSASHARISG